MGAVHEREAECEERAQSAEQRALHHDARGRPPQHLHDHEERDRGRDPRHATRTSTGRARVSRDATEAKVIKYARVEPIHCG